MWKFWKLVSLIKEAIERGEIWWSLMSSSDAVPHGSLRGVGLLVHAELVPTDENPNQAREQTCSKRLWGAANKVSYKGLALLEASVRGANKQRRGVAWFWSPRRVSYYWARNNPFFATLTAICLSNWRVISRMPVSWQLRDIYSMATWYCRAKGSHFWVPPMIVRYQGGILLSATNFGGISN